MPNEVLSSASSPRAKSPFASSHHMQPLVGRAGSIVGLSLLSGALLLGAGALGCGEEDTGLTYAKNIRPIFSERCTICHRPDGPSGIDIQNPYASMGGLVTSKNRFKEMHPELNIPVEIVAEGDPDNSFLLYK